MRAAAQPRQRDRQPPFWDAIGHPERRRISEDLFTLLFTLVDFDGPLSSLGQILKRLKPQGERLESF